MISAPTDRFDFFVGMGDSKPHAIVKRDGNKLFCFILKDNTYEEMTEQNSTDDQALTFKATEQTFVENCLPSIIKMTISNGVTSIAFLDMGANWGHEQLLKDWEKSQAEKPRQQDIFVQGFRMDGNSYPVKTTQSKLTRTKKESPAAPKPPPVKPPFPEPNPPTSQNQFHLDDVLEVPAEFMSFVWKSRRVSTGGNAPKEAWSCLREAERSLTTREVAERVYKKPSASEALSVYQELSAGINQHLIVPMIGFNQEWLFAKSYLTNYSNLKTYCMEVEDLISLRHKNYKTILLGRQREQEHLKTAIQRCLKSTYSGLRLLDLTEDVIYSLTGKTRVVLSLADVCRVRDLVEGKSIGR